MKMHKKITSVLSILLLMSMLLTACSGDGGSAAVTNDTADTTAAEVTEAETTAAPYSDINLDGYEMRILNVAGRLWNTMSVLDYETLSGDIVEDAVYNRNRAVESKLNIKLNVITPSDANSGIQNELNKAVSAGDDLYDAAYTTSDNMSANIVNGYYLNLKDIDTVQLGEAWWDPAFNDVLELNNKYLYQASSPLHLMAFDMSIACYFNKDMFVEKGLTIPYDLVREGKWTYDEMMKIIKAGISMNGDDKFDKSQKGNSTFGIATFEGWAGVLAVASDSVVGKDSDGIPTFTGASEKMLSSIEKLTDLLATDGHVINNYDGVDYDKQFVKERALFSIISIGNAHVFREMDSEYGILPVPKYTENDEYRALMGSAVLMGIPVTCAEAENSGLILDCLSYYSYNDVLPAYYDSLCYKSLRDDDSVEMLGIINESRTADLGRAYGWASDLINSMGTSLLAGSLNAASMIESYSESIATKIEATMSAVK